MKNDGEAVSLRLNDDHNILKAKQMVRAREHRFWVGLRAARRSLAKCDHPVHNVDGS
jgi:hypothetical protein